MEWNGTLGAFSWDLDANNHVWKNSSFQSVGWVNGSDAVFSGGISTVNVAGMLVAGTLTFDNAFTLADAGGSLQFTSITNNLGAFTQINANIAGTNGFTKNGAGGIALGRANGVSGTVNIQGGSIEIDTADALRNATVSVNVLAGLTFATNANFGGLAGSGAFNLAQRSLTAGFNNLDTIYSGNITGNNAIATTTTFTKVGGGTMAITGDWSGLAGRRAINGGFVAVSGLSFFNGTLVSINDAGLRFDADLSFGSTIDISRTGDFTTFDTNGHNVSFSGSLSGSGAFTKTGAGTLTLLPGSPPSISNLSILGGTLLINTLSNIGGNGSSTDTLTLNGGTFSIGTQSGEPIFRAVVFGGTGGTFDVRNSLGTLIVNSGITGTGGLTKTGSGTLQLSASATYSGATLVSGGTLQLTGASTLPSGTALTANNSTVIVNASQTLGSLAGASSTLQTGTLSTLTIGGNNTSTEFSGAITGGAGLVKIGSGTLTLSGANTFSGGLTLHAGSLILGGSTNYTGTTTVNAGTLFSAAAGGLPSDGVLVINGGTVDISNGTAVSPASLGALAGSGGLLQLGNILLTLGGNTTTSFGGAILGDTFSSITKNGTGTFTLAGSTNVDDIAVNAGVFALGSTPDALADATRLTIAAGAAFRLGSGDETIGSISGSGTVDLGTGVARALRLAATGSVFTYNGVIQGTGHVIVALGSGGSLTLNGTNTYGGVTVVESGRLNTGSSGTVLPDGTTLQLGVGAIVDFGSNETIGSLGAESGSVALLNGHTVTAGGNNQGTFFLGSLRGNSTSIFAKAGLGLFTLQGTQSLFTGTLRIDGGAVQLNGSGAVLTGTPTVTITASGNGQLRLGNFSETIGSLAGYGSVLIPANVTLTAGGNNTSTNYFGTLIGGGNFVKTGAGEMALTGTNVYGGSTTISGGTLSVFGSSNVLPDTTAVVINGATLKLGFNNETVGSLAGSGSVILGGGSFVPTLVVGNGNSTTYSGVISGPGGLTKQGPGTLALTGVNTFTGALTVANGAVQLGGSGTNLADTGAVVITGGQLRLGAANETIGSLAGAAGSVLLESAGPRTLTTGGNGATTSYSGQITGAGSLVKVGAGTMTISGDNNYAGGTQVNGGTLAVASSTALGAGTAQVGSSGTLQVSGSGTAVGNFIQANGGTVRVLSGASAANVAVNSNGTAQVNGTLNALVLNGGTLKGTGTVTGPVTVGLADTIAPGNSVGELTVGSLALGPAGRYEFQIGDALGAAGIGYDTIDDLSSLAIIAGPESGTQFTIAISSLTSAGQGGLAANWDASQPYQFVLVHAAEGIQGFDATRFAIDSTAFQNNLNGGSFSLAQVSNDLVLNFQAVPEPSTFGLCAAALAVGGAAGMLRYRRRS